MKIKILLLLGLMLLPGFASASWTTGVITGYDVWDADSAAGDFATATTTCASLESGAFLPSKPILLEMYANEGSLAAFADVNYWSSSSYDIDNAHEVDFLDGSTDYDLKSVSHNVRCVRSTPYNYTPGEVTAVDTELSDMLTEYFPAILLIFAALFALGVFSKLIRRWVGSRNV